MNKYVRIQKNYPKFLGYYIFTILMNILFIRNTGLILSFVEMIILTAAVLLYRIVYKIPINQVQEIKEHAKGLKVLLVSLSTNVIFSYLIFNMANWKFVHIAAITYLLSFYFLIPFLLKEKS